MRGKGASYLFSVATRLALKIIPSNKGLVFLTLHHLDDTEFEWFADVLDYLQSNFGFVDINNLEEHELTNKNRKKISIVLTFDDAFKCHKRIVDELLNPRQIKALFFVPTKFVGLTGTKAFEFARERFFPKSVPKSLNGGTYDAMTWDDLNNLVKHGHIIGGHSESHPQLSKVPNTKLKHEIAGSADFLASKIKVKIRHFAYPFGSIEAISPESYLVAKERFEWAYSNIRGVFKDSPSKHFIYRQNLVPKSPLWLVKAIVEGRLDFIYRKKHTLAKHLFH